MPAKRLPTLIGKVFTDPAFREKLIKDPGAIIAAYLQTEQALQDVIQSDKGESFGDKEIIYKLMPNRVSARFMVLPISSTETVENDLIPIYLDQWFSGASVGKDGQPGKRGRAFGSGVHPSTYLCLDALEQHITGSPSVLDVGTGTGILAIAAAKLGAEYVLAIDINESSVHIASSNMEINELENTVRVELGSIQKIKGSKFDLILANLTQSIHIRLLREGMMDLLAPDGKLILSGIENDRQGKVLDALKAAGGVVVDKYEDRGWVSLVVRWNR